MNRWYCEGPVSEETGPFCIGGVLIQLRQIDPSYLDYLRSYDPHVPLKASRPWLWPVRVAGLEYGAPLTSQDTGAGYAGFLRCGAAPEYGLNLQYMVPVPPQALRPAAPMTSLLRQELAYFEEIRKYIEAEAQILHRLSGMRQMNGIWQRNSCDFQQLESIYTQWQPGLETGHFLYPKEDEIDMPISKNGKPFYTQAQYETARYNSSALEYAQSQGYDLIRQSGYYKLREHDSMVFTPDGRWYWNSRGLSGGALEFMIYYENRTVVDAVLTLANDPEHTQSRPPERQDPPKPTPPDIRPAPEISKTAFRLPDKAGNFRYLFDYLCGKRGLEKSVVQEMIQQNRLYQSQFRLPSGSMRYNAVFVYLDDKYNPVGAYERGMMDQPGQPAYKREVPGSDKRFGWLLASPFDPATEVRVFEASIDAASDASLVAMKKGDAWRQEPVDRLALGGVSYQPLQNYLRTHPEARQVTFMLDADQPGLQAADRLVRLVRREFPGVAVRDIAPPFGKDWNEVLTDTRAMEWEARQAGAVPAPEPVPEA